MHLSHTTGESSMLNAGSVFVIWALGGAAWGAAVGLVFQDSVDTEARVLELVIVGLITVIGILFRYGYRDVTKQLTLLNAESRDQGERMAVMEHILAVPHKKKAP